MESDEEQQRGANHWGTLSHEMHDKNLTYSDFKSKNKLWTSKKKYTKHSFPDLRIVLGRLTDLNQKPT